MEKLIINFIGDTHATSSTPSSRKDNYPESLAKKWSLINKLSKSDLNVLLGDVFHKPTMSLKYVNSVARVERGSRLEDGHRTMAIVGNHDVFYGDSSFLIRTGLGNFIETGLVIVTGKHYSHTLET